MRMGGQTLLVVAGIAAACGTNNSVGGTSPRDTHDNGSGVPDVAIDVIASSVVVDGTSAGSAEQDDVLSRAEALFQRAEPLLGLDMKRVVVLDADRRRVDILCNDAARAQVTNWESVVRQAFPVRAKCVHSRSDLIACSVQFVSNNYNHAIMTIVFVLPRSIDALTGVTKNLSNSLSGSEMLSIVDVFYGKLLSNDGCSRDSP